MSLEPSEDGLQYIKHHTRTLIYTHTHIQAKKEKKTKKTHIIADLKYSSEARIRNITLNFAVVVTIRKSLGQRCQKYTAAFKHVSHNYDSCTYINATFVPH